VIGKSKPGVFRLAGFHPFADETDTPQEVRRNVLEQRCDPNLVKKFLKHF